MPLTRHELHELRFDRLPDNARTVENGHLPAVTHVVPAYAGRDRRNHSTRKAHTVCEVVRENQRKALVRSLENLISITTGEIAAIDAGRMPAQFASPAERARLVLELQDLHCQLGVSRPALQQAAE